MTGSFEDFTFHNDYLETEQSKIFPLKTPLAVMPGTGAYYYFSKHKKNDSCYDRMPGWDFPTGSREDIDKVMAAFGAYI